MLRKQHNHDDELRSIGVNSSSIQHIDPVTQIRDCVMDVNKKFFMKHHAKHLETSPMRLLNDRLQFDRNAVTLLTNGGDILELAHELRLPFVNWIATNQ
ncbi:putative serine/threonine-kinase GCN2-like protein, partial [Trifolium medium]|nr:putative serine/threonine-kinase GCN2-like protein [Trifolium medium]